MPTFKVSEKESRQRLDSFLVEKLNQNYSRSFIQRLILGGYICVNERVVKPHYSLKEEDIVSVNIPPQPPVEVIPEDIPLDIIFEDEDLLVVNKPAGMVVHPAAGNYSGTLLNALLFHCPELSKCGGDLRAGIVHRLDKDTSGLIVVAKTDTAHQSLTKQFRNRRVKRQYIALVRGNVELNEGVIDLPIGRHKKHREKMAIDYESKKRAVTYYKLIKRFGNFTMLELTPKTGRTHQLRVHLSFMGHPILGDVKYGGRAREINRQALHAVSLKFYHPRLNKFTPLEKFTNLMSPSAPLDSKHLTGSEHLVKVDSLTGFMEFTSELPQDMKALIS